MTTEGAANAQLFIALWPSPAVRRALAAVQHRWRWPGGAAPTAEDKLHLTLHFLGAVPVSRLSALARAIDLPCPRFTLVFDRAEVWPNRCAVLVASEVPSLLVDLHAVLADSLRRLHWPVEDRPFRPHVTLARKAAGAQPPAEPPTLRWPVRGYVLVQSAGGRYTPIARYG